MLDKPSLPYGVGFRSLTAEIRQPVALPVTGALPAWLTARCSAPDRPNSRSATRTYNHWFDGLAMLHRFAFAEGGVSYANCFLESNAFRAAARPARSPMPSSPPIPAARCSAASPRSSIPSSPTIAASMSPTMRARPSPSPRPRYPMRFSPETLETLGVFGYRRPLNGQVSTAHPHYDAKRACHYNYIVRFRPEERLSSVPHRRRRHAERGCRAAGRAARLHAQLRHERGPSRAHRVPAGGEPARPQAVGQAVHPELSLGAGARARVPCRREGHGPAGAHRQRRRHLRLPPRQRLRRRRPSRRGCHHLSRRRHHRSALSRAAPRQRAHHRDRHADPVSCAALPAMRR